MSSAVPTAETRPIDGDPYDHEGGDIPPTRVSCPFCERTGVTEAVLNMCRCGRWFEVIADG